MKGLNKGITLTECLCYIVIFTLLSLEITVFTLVVTRSFNEHNNVQNNEILFIQDLITDIEDYIFVNDENLYGVSNNAYFYLYTTNENRVLLTFNKIDNILFNEIEGKSLVIKQNSLNINIKNNYFHLKINDGNYNFILKVV